MSYRRGEMQMFTRAMTQGWNIPDHIKQSTIQMMMDIVSGEIKSSPREKIRAAECLAKIDSLNIAREGQEKSSRMEIQVLPPAYHEMPQEANAQMIDYLQRSALPAPESEAAHPEDGESTDE